MIVYVVATVPFVTSIESTSSSSVHVTGEEVGVPFNLYVIRVVPVCPVAVIVDVVLVMFVVYSVCPSTNAIVVEPILRLDKPPT